jgi:ribose transport system permease protein
VTAVDTTQSLGSLVGGAFRHRLAALVSLFAVIFLLLSIVTDTFLTNANLSSVAVGAAIDLVLVAGQVIVIIAGGFDLSIGSTAGLSAVTIGLLMTSGTVWWMAVIVGIAVGVGAGIVNGLLVAIVEINPLIATLGTLFAIQGIALVITNSETQLISGPLVDSIGQATWFQVPTPAWIGLFTVLAAAALMRWFRFGREVLLVGGNPEAARLLGISVARVRFFTYVLMGFLAGVAGALAIGRVGTANANTAANEELNVIAAAVIGGAALSGGEGSVIGAGIGVLLIGMVSDAVVLLDVSVFWQQLVVGVMLIIAVAANVVTTKIRHRIGVRAALSRAVGGNISLPAVAVAASEPEQDVTALLHELQDTHDPSHEECGPADGAGGAT